MLSSRLPPILSPHPLPSLTSSLAAREGESLSASITRPMGQLIDPWSHLPESETYRGPSPPNPNRMFSQPTLGFDYPPRPEPFARKKARARSPSHSKDVLDGGIILSEQRRTSESKRRKLATIGSVANTKPFPCEHDGCHSSFIRLYNLRSHELTHSWFRPYRSDFPVFNSSFGRLDHLKRYFPSHHPLRDPIRSVAGVKYRAGNDQISGSSTQRLYPTTLPDQPAHGSDALVGHRWEYVDQNTETYASTPSRPLYQQWLSDHRDRLLDVEAIRNTSRHVESSAGITNLERPKATIPEEYSSSGGNLRPISTPRARISSNGILHSMTTNSDVGVCRIQVDYTISEDRTGDMGEEKRRCLAVLAKQNGALSLHANRASKDGGDIKFTPVLARSTLGSGKVFDEHRGER